MWIVTMLIFFVGATVAQTNILVPNYDNVEHRLKVFDIKYPLILSCNVTEPTDDVLEWKKNDVDVSEVEEIADRYHIIAPEKKLIIHKTVAKDAGNYSCGIHGLSMNFEVISKLNVKVPAHSGVVEGEKLIIHCIAAGTDPKLHWEYGNETIIESGERYTLVEENGVKNAILILENVNITDAGKYKCVGRNKASEYTSGETVTAETYVRVMGRLAALWPFFGICTEVLILCTIILIYEKRRNKLQLEESDTDHNDK